MFTFIHAADIHLDSPLLNLGRHSGEFADEVRVATRAAFDNMVELAIQKQVAFVLIAGDLYDGDAIDLNTPAHIRRQFERLGEHGIRVFIVRGNHDAANKLEKAAKLAAPKNVRVFSDKSPESVRLENVNVVVHGQSFANVAVEEDLSRDYPPALAGWFNIGLLHTSCGVYEAHDTYAPSTIAGLTELGYDFWALGHIHRRDSLSPESPCIWYPGNLQGRHIREEGTKGCSLVTVDDERNVHVEFHPVDVVRWLLCSIDVSDCESAEDAVSLVEPRIEELRASADGRQLALRVELVGSSPAHGELHRFADHWEDRLRTAVFDRYDQGVRVEKVKLRTRPLRHTEPVDDETLQSMLGNLQSPISDSDLLDAVRNDVKKLLNLIPTDPRLSEYAPDQLLSEERMSELLRESRELLVAKLEEMGTPPCDY